MHFIHRWSECVSISKCGSRNNRNSTLFTHWFVFHSENVRNGIFDEMSLICAFTFVSILLFWTEFCIGGQFKLMNTHFSVEEFLSVCHRFIGLPKWFEFKCEKWSFVSIMISSDVDFTDCSQNSGWIQHPHALIVNYFIITSLPNLNYIHYMKWQSSAEKNRKPCHFDRSTMHLVCE